MSRVLVTGGAGFIGSHLVERLLADTHAVTALDNLVTGTWSNLPARAPALERIELDVCDGPRLAAVVRAGGFDTVVHLAAWASVAASIERPAEAYAVNLGGTLNVLEAARLAGVRRVVMASSAAVYGPTPPLPVAEDAPLHPASPYAAHKAAGELLCAAYRAALGVETVSLRYFNVYGRRQPADSPYCGVVARFAACLAGGQPVTVHGDGEQTRDFIHVSDAVEATARAALGPDPGGGPINVGTGAAVSVLGLLAAMRVVAGAEAAVTFAPARPGDARHSQADIARLRARLDFTPRVALREGLRDLLCP